MNNETSEKIKDKLNSINKGSSISISIGNKKIQTDGAFGFKKGSNTVGAVVEEMKNIEFGQACYGEPE